MTAPSPALRAILAFERLHGLLVTVHDRSGQLTSQLDPRFMTHRHPRCAAAKVTDVGRCVAFDVQRTARDLALLPEGRTQRCWAGVIEWVVPITAHDKPIAVLFAGAARLRQTTIDCDDAADGSRAHAPASEEQEGGLVLECLRQLAARLARLIEGTLPPAARRRSLTDPIPEGPGRRQAAILAFIEQHHQREVTVADLARALGLSVTRTIHVVRACCGQSFVNLLRDKRLAAAAAALRYSELDVLSVATRCGFGDVSHFHRWFKRRYGVTPLRYRLHSDA